MILSITSVGAVYPEYDGSDNVPFGADLLQDVDLPLHLLDLPKEHQFVRSSQSRPNTGGIARPTRRAYNAGRKEAWVQATKSKRQMIPTNGRHSFTFA